MFLPELPGYAYIAAFPLAPAPREFAPPLITTSRAEPVVL
ncbi:hypothetical protein PSCLAVI8L_160085 [Pseudoclavibacter sp. 8L]|nr:hypothetical protein PSCLAVI8L_160085 [Pseudoclavibacter sp. 8L]